MAPRAVLLLALALLLSACTSSRLPFCAANLQDHYEQDILYLLFDRWDLDEDASLSHAEFRTGIANENIPAWTPYFDAWDRNASESLDRNEFRLGWIKDDAFATWDADEDGYLDPEECPAAS